MKKLAIVLVLVAAACHRTVQVGSPPATNVPGAASATEALSRFLAAAKAQDLQAMGLIWGSNTGPVMESMPKDEREMREITLLCYLKHDSYRVLSQSPSTNNEHVFNVELRFKDLTRSTSFYTTLGPSNRWYMREAKIEALRDICAKR